MKNKIKNNNRRKRLQKLAKEVVPALDLESLIEKERVCLTDAIKYSTSGGIQSLNYYNFCCIIYIKQCKSDNKTV